MVPRTANLTAIIGGILVFRDSIGAGAVGITGRMIAFALVIAGAALIPRPAPCDSQHRSGMTASACSGRFLWVPSRKKKCSRCGQRAPLGSEVGEHCGHVFHVR